VDNVIYNSALTAVYFPVKSDWESGFLPLRVDTKKEEKRRKIDRVFPFAIIYFIINCRETFRLRACRFGRRVPRNRTLSINEKIQKRVKSIYFMINELCFFECNRIYQSNDTTCICKTCFQNDLIY